MKEELGETVITTTGRWGYWEEYFLNEIKEILEIDGNLYFGI